MRLSKLPLILVPFVMESHGYDSTLQGHGPATIRQNQGQAQDLEAIRANVNRVNNLQASNAGKSTQVAVKAQAPSSGEGREQDPRLAKRLKTNVMLPEEEKSVQKIFVNGGYYMLPVGPGFVDSEKSPSNVRPMDDMDLRASDFEEVNSDGDTTDSEESDAASFMEYRREHQGE